MTPDLPHDDTAPVKPCPPDTPHRIRNAPGTNIGLFVWGAIASLALVAGTWVVVSQRIEAGRARRAAEQALTEANQERERAELERWKRQLSEARALRIAATVRAEALAKAPVDGLTGHVLYRGGPGRAVNTGTLTADGRTLVIAASDSIVFLDLKGGTEPRVWGKTAHSVSLSPDGRWIATMLHNQVPVLTRTEDGRSVFWGERGGRIELSPDNRHFSHATMTEVWIHSLDTLQPVGSPIPLEIQGAAPPLAFSPTGARS